MVSVLSNVPPNVEGLGVDETHDTSMRSLAQRLVRGVTARDLKAVAALYAENLVVWRNTDGQSLSKARALKLVSWLGRTVRDLRYEDVRVIPTLEGYVQQHVLCGQNAQGEALRIPACLVVRVVSGHIVRIDEYLDASHTSPLATTEMR